MKRIYLVLAMCFSLSFYAQEEKQKDIFKNKGYFNITKFTHYRINNANFDFVDTDNSITREETKPNGSGNSLQTINGYFINPKLSLGIGLGFERFDHPGANTFPVFLDVRYYLENDYNSFYAFGDIGFLGKLGDDFRKGGLLHGGIGYKFFINSNKTIALVTDVGYYHRLIKVPFVDNPNMSDLTLNGFSFSVGILF